MRAKNASQKFPSRFWNKNKREKTTKKRRKQETKEKVKVGIRELNRTKEEQQKKQRTTIKKNKIKTNKNPNRKYFLKIPKRTFGTKIILITTNKVN